MYRTERLISAYRKRSWTWTTLRMRVNHMKKLIITLLSFTLLLVLGTDAGAADKKTVKKSGIKGTIVMKSTGEPVHKAYVYGYVGRIETRAAELGIIGITDWVSHGSAEDGTYTLDLPPGKYYIGARKSEELKTDHNED